MRDYLTRQSVAVSAAMVLTMTVTLVTVVSAVAYYFAAGWLLETADWSSLGRNAVITFVVTALALRYFYVTHEWRHNVGLQAKARVHALQARIRPHFLFNSMNTIAALTRSNPARAEEAVLDLAELFRANLNEKRNQIALAEEISVARTYQRMEQLRLGDRLRVDWKWIHCPTTRSSPASRCNRFSRTRSTTASSRDPPAASSRSRASSTRAWSPLSFAIPCPTPT
jgi:two-component system sensor histidine kinase AlgZ